MVPDVARLLLPILLAARLLEVARIILRAHHHDLIDTIDEQMANLGGKGCVPTFMLAGELAVHPYRRAVIDRAEMKDETFAPKRLVDLDRPPIPDDGMEARFVHARQ